MKSFSMKWEIVDEAAVREMYNALRALDISSVNDTEDIYEQATEIVLHMDSWNLTRDQYELEGCVQFSDVGLSFAGYRKTDS